MAGALPEYDVFDNTKDEGVACRCTRWIDWFEGMMDAMDITDDKKKYKKLFHYIKDTRQTLKKLQNNGIAQQDYNLAKQLWAITASPN